MVIVNNIECESFIVTGLLYNSKKRFSNKYDGTISSFRTVECINLWRGSLWGVTKKGKRKLLSRTYN